MNRVSYLKGLIVILLFLVLYYSQLPLGTAFEFGADEGIELLKSFMCSRGYTLYHEIWNDQPPVLTLLLAGLFKSFGPSLMVGRLIAAGFGMLLFGSVYSLVHRRAGLWTAILAVFFLLCAPEIALLSASIMLEVPAFATALLSACLLFCWQQKRHRGWLLASGIVLGVALQIKATSVLVAPAMLVEIAWAQSSDGRRPWWRPVLGNALQWGAATAITVVLIGAFWASGSLQTSWKSHFAEHPVSGMGQPGDFPFQVGLLWNHIECVSAAALALVLLAHHRRWREIAFPAILLLTALGIHAVHRPWWSYYYLHLAVPLAWFAGLATTETILVASKLLQGSRAAFSVSRTLIGVGLCVLTALILVVSERRLEASFQELRQCDTVDADPIVVKMKKYAERTHWVYSQREVYPFHARLTVPPELTVVVMKRFWSDQLSMEAVVSLCRRYQVEQLVLKRALVRAEWREFLVDFVVMEQDKETILYVAKRILDSPDGVKEHSEAAEIPPQPVQAPRQKAGSRTLN